MLKHLRGIVKRLEGLGYTVTMLNHRSVGHIKMHVHKGDDPPMLVSCSSSPADEDTVVKRVVREADRKYKSRALK